MKKTDIAIVGMSCVYPGADNVETFWNNLCRGVDSITDIPEDRIDPVYFQQSAEPAIDRFYCHRGGFIPETVFDPLHFGILPVAASGMEPEHLITLKMVYKALEDASVFKKNISLEKGAIVIGKGNYAGLAILRAIDVVHTGGQIAELLKAALPDLPMEDVEKVKRKFQADKGRFQADTAMGLIPNLVASLVANKLNMQGPAYTVDAACASSLIAVEHCVNELLSERSDIAVAGGIHMSHNSTFWSIFTQLGALSQKQSITPFSEDADGLLIGEGAGFVVLKRLETAIADNDRIYAVIKGVGVSSDGSGVGVMVPSIKGQRKAILDAWKSSGLDINKVGYIEAHGTATTVGDRTELNTLHEIFNKDNSSDDILLGSVKSNIGHTMPAAGMASLIKTALSLYHRQIPPTLHCEKPLAMMDETRFKPVQQLTNWQQDEAKPVAGVNAFGFGGINAHVVLEAFGEKVESEVSTPFSDEVIAITARTKDSLMNALDRRDFSLNEVGGEYRLVLFDPTDDRIEKAKKIIAKDKPWKGRQDIWFSNKSLLKNGGKVAFLFPGFDPASNPEIESLSNYFDLPIKEDSKEGSLLLSHSLKLYRGTEVIDTALNKLGVVADMNLGHSVGEWFACKASGLMTEASITSMLESMDPEQYKIEGVYFIALGCGVSKIQPWIDTIPDLYLANDNCPSQALLCGTEKALESIIEVLKKEQIYYQILSFQSGFHTPFIKQKLNLLDDAFGHLELQQEKIPMWSATSLDVYPHDRTTFKELTIKHLVTHIRFTELIQKLFREESARVFIQIGAGGLVGFVDDILKNEEYSVISTTTHLRSTLEQLRRVLALLFIEGKEVDFSFLGVKESGAKDEKGMKLVLALPLIKDFPLLREAASRRNSSFDLSAITSMATDTIGHHPIVQAMNENVAAMIQMQADVVKVFEQQGLLDNQPSHIVSPTIHATPVAQRMEVTQPPVDVVATTNEVSKIGQTFEEKFYVSLEDHPYIMDHSLVKQPKSWTCMEDLNPVIPMTMTLELLAETANRQAPSKKVTKIGPVSVFQWMNVHTPFKQQITGTWKTDDIVSLGIKNFVTGDITLSDSYPEPPAAYMGDIDLGENILTPPTVEKIYEDHMFHGPAYQGIIEVTHITKKGARGYIRKNDGKGSLLDNVGQLYGLFLQLIFTTNRISFPVKVLDITFYQDLHDQKGLFECVCLPTDISEEFAIGEIIIRREGKVWCIIKGWQNRRFEFDPVLWDATISPQKNMLAQELAPGVFFYHNAYNKAASWDFIMKRFLNQPEKKHYQSMPLNKRKEFLISRITLKDAVRSRLQKTHNKFCFPIEISVDHDTRNKPYAIGMDELKDFEISIAHKGTNAVSMAAGKPVGVDIETIEDRGIGFIELSFTEAEQKLFEGRDLAEWTTRFWVAKECYGKMLGVGLGGNPKQYEVEAIDEQVLIIRGSKIQTIRHDSNHIIGWTL